MCLPFLICMLGDIWMGYLEPRSSHGSTYNVVNYCLHGRKDEQSHGRAIAIDAHCIPEEDIENGSAWQSFDQMTKKYGNDLPHKGKKAVTYYHYVIAPDPKDFEGRDREEMLSKVQQCARSWAERCAPNQQWLIVYHNDSRCGNIHAHLIVGNTNVYTGARCHVSKEDQLEQRRVLDEESRRAGLSALGDRLVVKDADEALEERNAQRRERGEREVPKTVSSRQTTQKEVMTKAERYMRDGQSWKARLRQIVDECAWESDSFAGFQRLLRFYGCTATVTRSGQITYTIGDRRCSAKKLGMMYQTDFLASQFMDLRFTKAGWVAERGHWRQVRDAGLRVPKVTDADLEGLFPKMDALGVYNDRSASACVAQCREKAREAMDQRESLERNLKALSKDLDDAHLVASMQAGVEKGRVGGRIHLDQVPYGEGAVRQYEAARKRLQRRRYATDAASLEQRYADTMSALADARAQEARLTQMLRDSLDVQRILKGMGEALDSAQEGERLRYESRLADQRRAESRARYSQKAGHVPARIVFIRADGSRSDAGQASSVQWQDPDRTAKAFLAASVAQKPRGPIEIPVLKAPADLLQGSGNGRPEEAPTPIVQPAQQAPTQRPVPTQAARPAPAPVPAAPSVGAPAAAPSRGLDRLAATARPKDPVQMPQQTQEQPVPVQPKPEDRS